MRFDEVPVDGVAVDEVPVDGVALDAGPRASTAFVVATEVAVDTADERFVDARLGRIALIALTVPASKRTNDKMAATWRLFCTDPH